MADIDNEEMINKLDEVLFGLTGNKFYQNTAGI